MGTRHKQLLFWIGVTGALLVSWELLGTHFSTFALLVSTPGHLIRFAVGEHNSLLKNLLYTFAISLVGFLGACSVGLALAITCFRIPRLRGHTIRALQAIQVVPVLVFAPFVTIVFDVGPMAHVVISFLVGVFPFVTLVIDALVRMPSALTDVVRMYGIQFGPAVAKIYVPYVLPAIFAAARVSATLCVVGTTVAEFTGSRYGLGKSVFEAAIRIEPEKMVLSTLGIVLIGLFFVSTLRIVESRVIKWRH